MVVPGWITSHDDQFRPPLSGMSGTALDAFGGRPARRRARHDRGRTLAEEAVERNIHPGDCRPHHARAQPVDRRRQGDGPAVLADRRRDDPHHEQPGCPRAHSSSGAGCYASVVTAYSGNSFPSYAPNPIFKQAYESGEVAVEHWSILTLAQRLEAAARGLPAIVTGSVVGSDLAGNQAFSVVDSSLRPRGSPGPPRSRTWPCVTPPCPTPTATWPSPSRCSRGPGGRGRPGGGWWPRWSRSSTTSTSSVTGSRSPPIGCWPWWKRPSAPIPGAATPRASRWPAMARTSRSGSMPPPPPGATSTPGPTSMCWTHRITSAYLDRLGPDRLIGLRLRSDPDSWRQDAAAHPVPADRSYQRLGGGGRPSGPARSRRWWPEHRADAVLAGAGVANLAAWVAVARARAAGRVGVPHRRAGPVGLHPDAGRPLHLQPPGLPRHLHALRRLHGARHGRRRSRGPPPSAAWARPRWTSEGNINSTQLGDGRFLVGSGGANDVVSRAAACAVVTLGRPAAAAGHARPT